MSVIFLLALRVLSRMFKVAKISSILPTWKEGRFRASLRGKTPKPIISALRLGMYMFAFEDSSTGYTEELRVEGGR